MAEPSPLLDYTTMASEMLPKTLADAACAVSAGHWGIGLSGGSDSVALLRILLSRPDLHLHAIHLDHQTRAGASTLDAEFVEALCHELHVPLSRYTRQDAESWVDHSIPNLQSHFRQLRLA